MTDIGKLRKKWIFILLVLVAATVLVFLGYDDENKSDKVDSEGDVELRTTLKILHVNDVHSHLTGSSIKLTLGGIKTECEIGGMARVAEKIKELRAGGNTLVLHAGDAIQGTLYYTLFHGNADADVMNAIGFDAMAIGNHEFDDGDERLAGFINMLDCLVISANIDVADGNALDGLFSPYTIILVDAQPVGIIGVTIAAKTKNSS